MTIADLPEDPHESPFGEEDEPPPRRTRARPTRRSMTSVRRRGRRVAAPPAGDQPRPCASSASSPSGSTSSTRSKLTGWNISRTAIVLGVERTNLHKKIRAYQIKRGES